MSEQRSKKKLPRPSSSGARALETDWLVSVALRSLVFSLARLYNIVASWAKTTAVDRSHSICLIVPMQAQITNLGAIGASALVTTRNKYGNYYQ